MSVQALEKHKSSYIIGHPTTDTRTPTFRNTDNQKRASTSRVQLYAGRQGTLAGPANLPRGNASMNSVKNCSYSRIIFMRLTPLPLALVQPSVLLLL